MNKLRNKVQLIGNIGMDPEIKILESGKSLARISLATNERYRNSNGDQVEETQWHNLIAWGKTAEFIKKYLKKGNEIAIEGKIVNKSYQDKAGNKKYITEILINELLILSTKKGN